MGAPAEPLPRRLTIDSTLAKRYYSNAVYGFIGNYEAYPKGPHPVDDVHGQHVEEKDSTDPSKFVSLYPSELSGSLDIKRDRKATFPASQRSLYIRDIGRRADRKGKFGARKQR